MRRVYLASVGSATSTPTDIPNLRIPNPFLPQLNAKTGRWAPPRYSLRRQADLVKKAKLSDTIQYIPSGPKSQHSPTTPLASLGADVDLLLEAPVEWVGEMRKKPNSVPGSDIGARLYAGKKRMFKGHKWERVMNKKLTHRRMLMRNMRRRVKTFKQVCWTRFSLSKGGILRHAFSIDKLEEETVAYICSAQALKGQTPFLICFLPYNCYSLIQATCITFTETTTATPAGRSPIHTCSTSPSATQGWIRFSQEPFLLL